MSDIVKNAIAASVAALTQEVDFPQEPFGYGSDIDGDVDLSERMDEVDPFSTRAISQAIVRRLNCPRGGLPDDPNYGIDLVAKLNTGIVASDLQQLGGQIKNELSKDDRIAAVIVTLAPNSVGSTLRVELFVTPANSANSFRLTLNASDAGILIESIKAEN